MRHPVDNIKDTDDAHILACGECGEHVFHLRKKGSVEWVECVVCGNIDPSIYIMRFDTDIEGTA